MRLDCRKIGRCVFLANVLVTLLAAYILMGVLAPQAIPQADPRLFAPVEPVKKSAPQQQTGIFRDYSVISPDRFVPRSQGEPGDTLPPLPVPGPMSALDRLVKLRGTAVSPDKNLSYAIVEMLQGGEHRTVRVGEEVAGATVLEIAENSILVSMENEEVALFLNATEEYGAKAAKPQKDQSQQTGQAQAPGGRQAGEPRQPRAAEIPPDLQQYLDRLPPDMLQRWQTASPEDRQKYIQRFLERMRGGEGGPRPRRDGRQR